MLTPAMRENIVLTCKLHTSTIKQIQSCSAALWMQPLFHTEDSFPSVLIMCVTSGMQFYLCMWNSRWSPETILKIFNVIIREIDVLFLNAVEVEVSNLCVWQYLHTCSLSEITISVLFRVWFMNILNHLHGASCEVNVVVVPASEIRKS